MGEAAKRFRDNREPKPDLPGSNSTMRAMRDRKLKELANADFYKVYDDSVIHTKKPSELIRRG